MGSPLDRAAELRKVFAAFDYDGSGAVGREELQVLGEQRKTLGQIQRVWTPERNARLMQRMDENGNGVIDEEEFVKHFMVALRRDSDEAFMHTMEDFKKCVPEAAQSIAQVQVAAGAMSPATETDGAPGNQLTFDDLDKNGDGIITREEFAAKMTPAVSAGSSMSHRPSAAESPHAESERPQRARRRQPSESPAAPVLVRTSGSVVAQQSSVSRSQQQRGDTVEAQRSSHRSQQQGGDMVEAAIQMYDGAVEMQRQGRLDDAATSFQAALQAVQGDLKLATFPRIGLIGALTAMGRHAEASAQRSQLGDISAYLEYVEGAGKGIDELTLQNLAAAVSGGAWIPPEGTSKGKPAGGLQSEKSQSINSTKSTSQGREQQQVVADDATTERSFMEEFKLLKEAWQEGLVDDAEFEAKKAYLKGPECAGLLGWSFAIPAGWTYPKLTNGIDAW